MAIAVSPKDSITVYLSEDDDAPEESKTPIKIKALSGREFDRLSREIKPITDGEFNPLDADEMDAVVWNTLARLVRGWDNLKDEDGQLYSPELEGGFSSSDSLKEAFSLGQAIDLCMKIVEGNMLTADQKKASKSLPDSQPDS